jgi:hypothetical protein
MVKHHDGRVRGVDLRGTRQHRPVLLQMHDTDFPAHFLKDLANNGLNPVSSTQVVSSQTSSATPPPPVPPVPAPLPLVPLPPTLFQPVQRIVHLAIVQLNCDTLGFPPLATTRIASAGLVIRRVYRKPSDPKANRSRATDELTADSWAWMRSAQGTFNWRQLSPDQARLDPDPTRRPQLQSGQADLDQLLTAMSLSSAYTEVFTPAFVAAPDICNALGRTVVYALIPTASSEVSDPLPLASSPPAFDRQKIAANLPPLLKSGDHAALLGGQSVDFHWLSDDFLWTKFPPADSTKPYIQNQSITDFQSFTTTLRMLQTVFGAFDTPEGRKIVEVLNAHQVIQDGMAKPMGDFYDFAANALLGPDSATNPGFNMPTQWDRFSDQDQNALLDVLIDALAPQAAKVMAPQGRFQDPTRLYTATIFLRIKPENPACPTQLIWSLPSEPFRIAAWYESAGRAQPPILLPDPSQLRALAQPNASFQVPAALMNAMQGSSLSGMMKGAKGGGGITIDWICGFSIPLITICAFFVLNIFFSLLAIIFFWLPFFKICIPIPLPKNDGG